MKFEERIRRARFLAAASTQTVADLQTTIDNLEQTGLSLRQLIAAEEFRTRVNDQSHPVYSLVATDAFARLTRLQTTLTGLQDQLRVALLERNNSIADLSALEGRAGGSGMESKLNPAPAPLSQGLNRADAGAAG
jgi:hypothetical protein